MKKVLFLGLIVGMFGLDNACADSYELSGSMKLKDNTVLSEWGDPYVDTDFVMDSNREPTGFRIKEGWACCTNLSYEQVSNVKGADRTEEALVSVKDDQAVMVYIAKKIYKHGGYFCLTQLGASSGDVFRIRLQQPNWPRTPCVVLCEPGWDGKECNTNYGEGNADLDISCDTTDVAAYIEEVRRNKYNDNDAFMFHDWRPGTADEQEFFQRKIVSNRYEHVVLLGVSEFMTHGVVAQPMLIATVGIHPAPTIVTSGSAISGKIKTLCAQGFTKNNKCEVSSKNCGSNVWCNGYSDANFKSNIHMKKIKNSCNIIVCKDRSKALDSKFNCVDYDNYRNGFCEVTENDLYGKLVECGEGYVFNRERCDCDEARSVSKDVMRYGPRGRNTDVLNEQCWTKETAEDFKNCVFGMTPVESTVTEY